MKRWEYAVIRTVHPWDEEAQEVVLDRLGQDGWELVGVNYPTLYLKRELR